MNAAADFRARLIVAGVVGASVQAGASWVCLEGGLTDAISAPQIAVLDRPGLPPLGAHDGPSMWRPGVQVLVRGAPGDYALAKAKAEAVMTALHFQKFGDVAFTAATTSALWLGYTEDERRPQWSLNFQAYLR